ncbi:MAG: glycosyltransferase, partial [Planctomycetota bacterium]|nr:glycosyltransferase [Planctomycetota bacterium]
LRLLLVGAGPLESALRQQASSSGVESQIMWLGEGPGPQIMPAFDMFVLPSLYEGLPYVLLEAMACGLPIVSTRVGGARFLIQEGYNGYTVPPGDAQALAQAMTSLAADTDLRQRMGHASRQRVRSFSLQRMVNDTTCVYQELLRRRDRTRSQRPADPVRP